MVKLIALYKKPKDIKQFEDHYFNIHVPLANKMPGLRRTEVCHITGTPKGMSEYHLIAELYFDDMEALKAAMVSPEGKAAAKDVMSFAGDIVYMMFAEVEEKVPAKV